MKRLVLLSALLVSSFSVSAKVTTMVCNGCSDITTRQLAADRGTGDHFFFDMTNRKLTHWSVNLTNGKAIVLSRVPTADQQKVYVATQSFYDAVGSLSAYGETQISTTSPRGVAMMPPLANAIVPQALNGKVTAFDVVETTVAKQAVLDDLTSLSFPGFTNIVRISIGYLMNSLGNNAVINVPINVMSRAIMPDGSSIVAKWNFQTGEFDYVAGSAKDAVGNPIPEDSVSAAGGLNSRQIYVFPNTPLGQMAGLAQVQRMNSLGINVKVVTTTSPWIVACVNNAGRTTCTASMQ